MSGAAAVNSVTVDVDAAAAELEAIAAADEREHVAELEHAAELEHDAAGHDPAAWSKAAEFLVDAFAGQGAPNWELDAEDRRKIATELAAVLDHYFPGGPNGVDNWHPLYRLGFAFVTVAAVKGMDWRTGRLKPLRAPQGDDDANDQAAERHASVPDGQDPERKISRRFTLGGEA